MPAVSCIFHVLPHLIFTMAMWGHFFNLSPFYGVWSEAQKACITWPQSPAGRGHGIFTQSAWLQSPPSSHFASCCTVPLNLPLCSEFTIHTSKWINGVGITKTGIQNLPWHPFVTSVIGLQSRCPPSHTVPLHKLFESWRCPASVLFPRPLPQPEIPGFPGPL